MRTPPFLLPVASTFAVLFTALIAFNVFPASSLTHRPLLAASLVLVKAAPALSLSSLVFLSSTPSFTTRAVTALAIGLCSVGDASLEAERTLSCGPACFLVGLGSFLLAHIFFAVGYLSTAPRFEPVVALAASTPPLVVLCALWPHVSADAAHAPLKPALVAYASALALLLYAAVVRTPTSARNWGQTVGGAVVFLLSDAVLAWDRFAPAPVDASGAVRWWWCSPSGVVMATYYTAITLLATAAVLAPDARKRRAAATPTGGAAAMDKVSESAGAPAAAAVVKDKKI
jgi:hypothetical protein